MGAIPSGLLSEKVRNGFASMISHVRCRLGLPGTETSTNQSYIYHGFMILRQMELKK